MQLKCFREILNPENDSFWLQLPRYWIGLDLSLLHAKYHFLRNFPRFDAIASLVEKRPVFYKNMLGIFTSIFTESLVTAYRSTKMFYDNFLELDEHFPTSYTSFWNGYQVDPNIMWKHVHNSTALGLHQDVHFRFLHQVLPTNEYKLRRFQGKGFRNTNPKCDHCPDKQETNIHVFFECPVSRPIRDFVRKNVQILLRGKPFELFRITLNVFPDEISGNIQKMVTGLLQIAFHVIWNNRNQFKFKRKITTFQESYNTISKQFKSAIDAEFQTLDPRKFSQRFCHTSSICKIHNNRLVVNLYY